VNSVVKVEDLSISNVETNLSNLVLTGKHYKSAFNLLKEKGFEALYECQTTVLTNLQRELYKEILAKAPKGLEIFLDPIIISFALRDACDVSGSDYVWIDLEGGGEIGCGAWVKDEDREKVSKSAIRLLRTHLEKYIIDAYDRRAREDMIKLWEAQLNLKECPVCGRISLDRRPVIFNKYRLRSWVCSDCGHHVILHSDALKYLEGGGVPEASK
jgi:hypothetical protein